MSTRHVRAVLTGLMCGAVFLGVSSVALADPSATPTTAPTTAPGDNLSNEQVAAIAKSGVVFVDVKWSGYVQLPATSTYAALWSDRIKTEATCSGYVADPTGYIVTAGHCVDPDEGRIMLIDQFMYDELQKRVIDQAEYDALLPVAEVNWKVEGHNNGSAIVLATTVYQTSAASSVAVSNSMKAAVIEDRPLDKGDVALLKVTSPTPLPALETATAEPEVGATIAAIGFPGSVTAVVDPSLEPSFETGQVSAMQNYNGLPFLQHSAAISAGMSGGPVVNMQGQVVGIVSSSPSGETAALNFAAGSETITGLLRRGGVDLKLSDTDQTYRDGLTSYFAKDYRSAIPLFDKVLTAIPSHALAQHYSTKAKALVGSQPLPPAPIVVPPESSGIPMFVWIGAGALVLLVAGGVLFLVRRKRTPVAIAPVAPVEPMVGTTVMGPAMGLVPEPPHVDNVPVVDMSTHHFCSRCGTATNGAPFCPNCGMNQHEMIQQPLPEQNTAGTKAQ